MSTEYKLVTDRLIAILDEQRVIKLSENLSTPVTAVKKGQYTPTARDEKPIVYARANIPSLIADMAGGLSTTRRLKSLISGATRADDQDTAMDDATNLVNNLEHVLLNHANESGYWNAGRLGYGYSEDDRQPEDFAQFSPDPGQEGCVVHFTLLWSCDIRVGLDLL